MALDTLKHYFLELDCEKCNTLTLQECVTYIVHTYQTCLSCSNTEAYMITGTTSNVN